MFFPLPEPLIQGRRDAGDESARRHQENVEVGPFRLFAHQSRPTMPTRSRRRSARRRPTPMPLPSEVEGLSKRPEADNLVGIFAALNGQTKAEVLKTFGGGNFSTFKSALVDLDDGEDSCRSATEMKRLTKDESHIDGDSAAWRGAGAPARAGDDGGREGHCGFRALNFALFGGRKWTSRSSSDHFTVDCAVRSMASDSPSPKIGMCASIRESVSRFRRSARPRMRYSAPFRRNRRSAPSPRMSACFSDSIG